MKNNIDNNLKNKDVVNQWYKSTVATAVVGALFASVILVLILINFIRSSSIEAQQEQELFNLKIEIQNNPDDEQLLEKIRQRDLEFRQNLFRRMDYNRKGGYLLLASVIIMLIGFKLAGTIRKTMPAPQHGGDNLTEQVRDAVFSRWSVTAVLVILIFAVVLITGTPGVMFPLNSADFPTDEEIAQNWPRFRGPGGAGTSDFTNIPESWNGETGENILWKSEVHLPGRNSPVVWKDRVFIAGGDPNKFSVFCYDADTGDLLWTGDVKNLFAESQEEPFDVWEDTGYSAPTVATDGQRVYAIFTTGIVACFDFNGNKIWEKDLGIPDSAYGYATSLEMFQNMLLIQFDQGRQAEDERSKLIALDGATSRVVWETPRPVPNSWTTPIVVKIDDEYQLITAGDPWVIAYDPSNGKELWRVDCLGTDVAPSPIYAGGLVFVIKPYSSLVAIRPDGKGDVTETHIAWDISDNAPDISSPVSNGEYIYLLTMDGYMTCFRVSDGQRLYEAEVGDYFHASPAIVGDKLYLLSEDGVMYIAQVGPEYKELAQCEIEDEFFASPAFVDGRIYIRGVEYLYCIENKN